jgi:hypothetical protein
MTFPIQFGLPQVILLLIALSGLALLLYAAHGLLVGEKRYKHLTPEEKEIYYKHGRLPRRRRLRWQHSIGGVLLVFLATSLLWLTLLVQAYLGVNGEVRVAHVVATRLPGPYPEMSVTLTLYDSDGNPMQTTITDPQGHTIMALSVGGLVYGDEWTLEADYIKVVPWLTAFGVHSGYKVTRLEGRFDDIHLANTGPRSVYAINGGDDGFFQHMQDWHGWISPFIDAQYGSATFTKPGTYDVFASQDTLIPRPASS